MATHANALAGFSVTCDDTPTEYVSDGGTLRFLNAGGDELQLFLSKTAVAGVSAAVTETAPFVLVDNDSGRAIAAEIIADF